MRGHTPFDARATWSALPGASVSAHGGLGRRAGLSTDDIEAARNGRGGSAREQAEIDFPKQPRLPEL